MKWTRRSDPVTERHFAVFDLTTGRCTREWRGDVTPPPRWVLCLPSPLRAPLLDRWVAWAAQPARHEIALDVTHLGYPEGDFCWARFDAIDRVLSFPEMHYFVTVDRATMQIAANHACARPVRSSAEQAVIDITGTALQPLFGSVYGQLARAGARWVLEPSAWLPAQTRAALASLSRHLGDDHARYSLTGN